MASIWSASKSSCRGDNSVRLRGNTAYIESSSSSSVRRERRWSIVGEEKAQNCDVACSVNDELEFQPYPELAYHVWWHSSPGMSIQVGMPDSRRTGQRHEMTLRGTKWMVACTASTRGTDTACWMRWCQPLPLTLRRSASRAHCPILTCCGSQGSHTMKAESFDGQPLRHSETS